VVVRDLVTAGQGQMMPHMVVAFGQHISKAEAATPHHERSVPRISRDNGEPRTTENLGRRRAVPG
jgi:hypothetical protein